MTSFAFHNPTFVVHSLLDILKGYYNQNGTKSSEKDSFDHVTKLKWPLTRSKLSMGCTPLIVYNVGMDRRKNIGLLFFSADFIVIFHPFYQYFAAFDAQRVNFIHEKLSVAKVTNGKKVHFNSV